MSAILQRKLEHARRRMDEGDLAAAVVLCDEVLAQAPRNPQALWLLGMARLMGGDPQGGVEPLEQALTTSPTHGMLLDGVGLAYLMLGRYDEAERALRKAAAAPGAPPIVHMRLGMALTNLGRHDEAATELQHVLSREPGNIDARVNLGLTYARAGDSASAEREFMSVLSQAPDHPNALYNVGVIKLEAGAPVPAEIWFRKAVSIAPDYLDARVNLGVALHRQGRLEEAAVELRQALAQQPSEIAALDALAQVLRDHGQHAESRRYWLMVLDRDPASVAGHEGVAVAALALGRFQEAATNLREVVRAEPANAGAWNALGEACFEQGLLDEAHEAAERARGIDSSQAGPYITQAQVHYVRGELDRAAEVLEKGYASSHANHLLGMSVHLFRRLCDWPRWRPAWDAMRSKLDDAADLGSPYWLLFEDTTPEQQLDYTRRWAAKRFAARPRPAKPLERAGPAGERLRIGYFSADFHEHPVARLIVQVLELHDRSRFEVFAYSHGPDDGSEIRARIRNGVEHFVDIAAEPDDRAVERIRADRLDLLIDLRAYTMGDRLQIMAPRPARVQASWLGYPGGTGADFIDYLIADDHIVPEEAGRHYSEKVVRMPHCYQPNDRKRPIGETLSRKDYGLPEDAFVFCCFNQTVKYTPDMFSRWMSLLKRVPQGVLWLLDDNPWASASLIEVARAAGVVRERLVFAPRLPVPEHLARYRAADIALDTFPYGSHTTGSDALWAGCPMVALSGSTFASRVSGSLLSSCGLSELIARSFDEYESLAYRLATEPAYLAATRSRLATARDTAPLFDSEHFARDLEQLYLRLAG